MKIRISIFQMPKNKEKQIKTQGVNIFQKRYLYASVWYISLFNIEFHILIDIILY